MVGLKELAAIGDWRDHESPRPMTLSLSSVAYSGRHSSRLGSGRSTDPLRGGRSA